MTLWKERVQGYSGHHEALIPEAVTDIWQWAVETMAGMRDVEETATEATTHRSGC